MKALKISKPIVLLLLTLALVSCKKDDEPQIPSVITASAINITSESVTCGGQIKSDGGEEIIEKGICISTTPKPTTAEGKIVSEETSDIFEFNIDRLSGSTKYYVRAFATNKIGTAYGSEVQFTTNAAILPTIVTIPASEISYKKARLGVTATFDGGATISELGICYSTAENPTISNNKIMLSSGTGTKTAVISSFQANTTYYVKAYAINSVGTVYGEQISFTTLTPVIPSIGQFNIQNITLTKAIAFIRVNTDGGSDIIERGVCYSSIMINPTTSNSKVVSTGTTGKFTCNINNLATNTMYHARAYATNAVGTTYSSDIQFRTSATTIDDVDGNTYDVIEIGNQAWLKQNLKTTKYRNGETIGTTTLDITNENEPKYQWPATGFESNAYTFGRLYTYYTATDSRGLCPDGWHVANTNEWDSLIESLGGTDLAGGKLKSFLNWASPNTGASDEVGFSAYGSGSRKIDGSYQGFDTNCVWWALSYEATSSNAWTKEIFNNNAALSTQERDKKIGYSVRCIKN